MTNHPNRSKEIQEWTIRFHRYFPITAAGEARAPENRYVVFCGTRAEAIARYNSERNANPRSVQITLYHSFGPLVCEARGTAEDA